MEYAIRNYPRQIGWLDGVPATDREKANRIVLKLEADLLTSRATAPTARISLIQTMIDQGRASELYPDVSDPATTAKNELFLKQQELADITHQQQRLTRIFNSLTKLGERTGFLLGIDPTGDGKVIIADHNPDTTRHTAVWVPGLGTTLDNTRSNVNRIINLQDSADTLTLTVADDVSTIMWLGYDAPELGASVALSVRAKAGAGPSTHSPTACG